MNGIVPRVTVFFGMLGTVAARAGNPRTKPLAANPALASVLAPVLRKRRRSIPDSCAMPVLIWSAIERPPRR